MSDDNAYRITRAILLGLLIGGAYILARIGLAL